MKKIFKFFAAALAIVAAASCAKENSEPTSDSRNDYIYEMVDVVFNATINSPSDPSFTKTSLANDGLTVHWTEGDEIAPFPYGGTGQNDQSPYEGRNWSSLKVSESYGASAVFEGTIGNANKYGAVYPKSSLNFGNCYGSMYDFKSITPQVVQANDFPLVSWGICNLSMALNYAKDDVFKFRNQLAYIKFKVGVAGIKTIEVSSSEATLNTGRTSAPVQSSTANLGGSLRFMTAYGKYALSQTSDPIIVTCDDGEFKTGQTYYIAIPAVTMSGFRMLLKDANGGTVVDKTRVLDLVAESNTIYNIGTLGGAPVGENVGLKVESSAKHIYENGNLVRTDVYLTLVPDDASKISDFSFSASMDGGYRLASTSSPSGTITMSYTPYAQEYVTKGDHTITYNYIVNGNRSGDKAISVNVPAPDFSVVTNFENSYSLYKAGRVTEANQYDPWNLNLSNTSVGIDNSILAKSKAKYKVTFNGDTYSNDSWMYNSWTLAKSYSGLRAGEYTLITEVTFDGVTRQHTQKVYVTGLPLKSFAASDWNGGEVKDGAMILLNNATATLNNLFIPSDINADVNLNATLNGHNSNEHVTYVLNIGDFKYTETTSGYQYSNKSYNLAGEDVILHNGKKVSMSSTVNYDDLRMNVSISKFEILYR